MGRHILTSVVVAVYLFFIEFLFHAVILKGQYEGVQHMLRPEGENPAMFFSLLIIAYLIAGFLLTHVFGKGYQGHGIGEGVRFGLLMGVLLAVPSNLINYAVQPWPGSLVAIWIIGYIIEFTIAGVIIAAMYKPSASPAAA